MTIELNIFSFGNISRSIRRNSIKLRPSKMARKMDVGRAIHSRAAPRYTFLLSHSLSFILSLSLFLPSLLLILSFSHSGSLPSFPLSLLALLLALPYFLLLSSSFLPTLPLNKFLFHLSVFSKDQIDDVYQCQ